MSAAAEQVRVRSVEDLTALMHHANPAFRLAAYSSIASDTKKALQLKQHGGGDILDVLIERLDDSQPQPERMAILATIGEFEDSRATDVFRMLLLSDADDETLHAAARFVHDRNISIESDALLELLRDSERASRVRIAAELLGPHCAVNTRDRIRMAAFSPQNNAFPSVDDRSIVAWRSELSDVFGEYIRSMMERQSHALSPWIDYWESLDVDTRLWLSRCACYRTPVNDEIIRLALSDSDRIQSVTRDLLNLYGGERIAAAY